MTQTAPDQAPQLDSRRKRILFRANHRGTHETDLLVGGFVTARITSLTDAELDQIEEIMELPDPDLADWLSGRREIPAYAESPMLRAMLEAALAEAARMAASR